jgi:SNF2 family DNA or RNA helicase
MQQMLEFWQKHQEEHPEVGLLEFMKLVGDEDVELAIDLDDQLSQMLSKLTDKTHLELSPDPENFAGTLRPYQQRGLSWLHYLEALGLN